MALPALRLAVGTLTVLPVGELPEIDPAMAARAMLLAPLAVVPLAVGTGAVGWLGWSLGLPGLVTGLLMVGAVALGTRAMHLDGLADTVDGLGSGWHADRSLTIMKRGDLGPMGAVALIIAAGLQAAALAELAHGASGAAYAGLILCASRGALALVCRRGVPPARATGLGVVVSGTVPRGAAVASWLVIIVVLAAAFPRWWLGAATGVLSAVAVLGLVRHCVRRLGGVTGDVMGAAIELAFTIMVVGAVAV